MTAARKPPYRRKIRHANHDDRSVGRREHHGRCPKSWSEIAWEPVVERNPQVIVIVTYGDLTAEQKIAFMKANPAFAGTDAVIHDRLVVLDYVEATPGPRNIAAVEKLVAGFAAK